MLGFVRLAPRCCLFCSPELAAIGPNERRQSRAPRRHPKRFARASLRTRQMHSTIRRRTCRSKPGALLRSEPLKDVILPAGIRGWRILYATTVDDSTPATAVATVFAPTDPPAGPRPVIAWEHATTGLLQKCMPSLLSTPTKGIPWRNRIVMAGWVVVATDYSFAEKGGPHPYLIGEGEARATLDSVRAARQMSELTLDKRMVVWGYSQGGHAALWTGIVGPRYAPDLEILGVAAIAPAANIKNILAMNVESG